MNTKKIELDAKRIMKNHPYYVTPDILKNELPGSSVYYRVDVFKTMVKLAQGGE